MQERILLFSKRIFKQELLTGSIYIFIGSVISNIFNLLFNLFMSRNLLPEDYGVLISAISLITLVGIPVGALTPMIVNFAGAHFAKKDYSSVKTFSLKIIKALLIVSIITLFYFMFFADQIGRFLKIDRNIIVIIGITIGFAYIGVVSGGLLQAKLAFKFISFVNVISLFSKLLVGVILFFLGFGVKGAIWAVFISVILPIIFGFFYLRFVFLTKSINLYKFSFNSILPYGVPSAITLLGITSLISTDILLVKHYFDPVQAGIYSGLSLVGKVIFFFTAPIGSVMFPLIIKKHAKKENYNNTFKMAIVMVFVPSVFISIFYFLYPRFAIIFFIKNEAYLSASSLLGLFGVFIAIYSLISLFVYYFLSIKKTNIYISVLLAAIAQVFLIILYHDSLFIVVSICVIVSLILLTFLLFYYLREYVNYKRINKQMVIIGKPGEIGC